MNCSHFFRCHVTSEHFHPGLLENHHPSLIRVRLGKQRLVNTFYARNLVINDDCHWLSLQVQLQCVKTQILVIKLKNLLDPLLILCNRRKQRQIVTHRQRTLLHIIRRNPIKNLKLPTLENRLRPQPNTVVPSLSVFFQLAQTVLIRWKLWIDKFCSFRKSCFIQRPDVFGASHLCGGKVSLCLKLITVHCFDVFSHELLFFLDFCQLSLLINSLLVDVLLHFSSQSFLLFFTLNLNRSLEVLPLLLLDFLLLLSELPLL
jgi:hypothetical protein